MIKLEILSDPIPLGRPRFNGRRAYLPKRSREYRQVVQSIVRAQLTEGFPDDCDLVCQLKFYRKFRPSSRRFGDIDNLCKAVFDALQGLVFNDDTRIVSLSAQKFQDVECPRTEIFFDVQS